MSSGEDQQRYNAQLEYQLRVSRYKHPEPTTINPGAQQFLCDKWLTKFHQLAQH